jgi:hypothetical protein
MRAILIAVAILFVSNSTLAQQTKQPPVSRTFVPDEPQPCVEFDGMAARLDAVYKIEEISKAEYDEGMKKYADGTSVEGVDYFVRERALIGEKARYQRVSLQRNKLAEFIRWYAADGGRRRMTIANAHCKTEMGEREERYSGIYDLRQLQDTMTISQAEGLLADVALEGQSVVIKALLESESAHRKDVERYNKLVESVNAYNKAVNDLVVTVNTAMNESKGSNLAPTLSFNFVRLQPITCTGNPIPFTDSKDYMTRVYTAASMTPIHCE